MISTEQNKMVRAKLNIPSEYEREHVRPYEDASMCEDCATAFGKNTNIRFVGFIEKAVQ